MKPPARAASGTIVRVYVVTSCAAEESWVEGVFAERQKAVAFARELADMRAEKKRAFYKDKKFAAQWEIAEEETDSGIVIRVSSRTGYSVSVKAWLVQT
jgi:predicted RNA-binding protein with PIN domain